VISAAPAAPRCRQATNACFADVRVLTVLGLVGLWQAASLLHGSLLVTALLTIGAAALGAWAIAVLREG